MPSQHKRPAISFRPAEGDHLWLVRHAAATGRPVNAILRQALSDYRTKHNPGALSEPPLDPKGEK